MASLNALILSELPWQLLLALALVALLLRFRPHERQVYLNTLWLFLIGVFGQATGAVLDVVLPNAAAVVHTIFRVVTAVSLIRLGGFAFFRLLLPAMRRPSPLIVEDLAIVGAYVVYGFVHLRGAGVDLSSLVTTSAILTAVIAFAMQDTLGNVLGGIAIQIDNTVQVGDWVRVDDHTTGQVRDIRWRSTLIETRNWETLVIPNSLIMKGRVAILGKRYGAPLQWRRTIEFMVDPRVPPARVIATINEEMRDVPIGNVARSPLPSTVLHGFQDGNLMYHLRYWLTDFMEDEVTDGMVRVHLFASMQRAGIRVAERQHTVHAVSRDEAHADAVRKRELGRRLEMLRGVDLFSVLSEQELNEIAERLQYAPFARGDIVTKQGQAAHWLYIIAFGEAEVRYEGPTGASQQVGNLRSGQFFGEMALLTGDARSATVVAKTDVECYRLDRAAFQGLLFKRPEIAEGMSKVISSRRPELERVRELFASQPGTQSAEQADLLSRIRRFFGLRR